MWNTILHSAAVHGALIGWAAAAAVDLDAFRKWQKFHDLVEYDWNTAIFRWLKGAALGALSGAGLNAMFSVQ